MTPPEARAAPEVFVVAGPNGAGKTTLALEIARDLGIPYVGADDIAARLNPEDPAAARVAAGRAFFAEVERLGAAHGSFVCESTLSGRGFAGVMTRLRGAGFRVTVQFVFVSDPTTCLARVAERVLRGGHDVPASDVVRRFSRSAHNFWTRYRDLADDWQLFYNGPDGFREVASGGAGTVDLLDGVLLDQFLALLRTDDR